MRFIKLQNAPSRGRGIVMGRAMPGCDVSFWGTQCQPETGTACIVQAEPAAGGGTVKRQQAELVNLSAGCWPVCLFACLSDGCVLDAGPETLRLEGLINPKQNRRMTTGYLPLTSFSGRAPLLRDECAPPGLCFHGHLPRHIAGFQRTRVVVIKRVMNDAKVRDELAGHRRKPRPGTGDPAPEVHLSNKTFTWSLGAGKLLWHRRVDRVPGWSIWREV